MMPPQVKPTGKPEDGNNFHTADMLIYDEESDKHVRITWAEALKATLADQLDGQDLRVSKGHSGFMDLQGDGATWLALAKEVSAYSSGLDFDDGSEKTVTWESLQKSGALEVRIVVARPFIEHLMVRCSPIGHARASDSLTLSASLRSTTPSLRSRGARRAPRFSARRTCSFRPTPRSRPSRVRAAPACTRTRTPPCTTR